MHKSLTSFTHNGAPTHKSSGDPVIDLFFIIAACRNNPKDAITVFNKAFESNPDAAIRTLLWARDIRQGAGERHIYRAILNNLSDDIKIALIEKTVELGRWDDLLTLLRSPDDFVTCKVADFWKSAVMAGHALAAKWAPRKGKDSVILRTCWKMSPKQYRKTLVAASTDTVESKMCSGNWQKINYSHVPSVAMARLNRTFMKHDNLRYSEYRTNLVKKNPEVKINASAIFPHDVVRPVLCAENDSFDHDIVNAQWNSLPNMMSETSPSMMVMADVSGSMWRSVSGSIQAIDISIALGLYIAQRQKGVFKNRVLTFSNDPQIHIIDENDGIVDVIRNMQKMDWGMSTNLYGAFTKMLQYAVQYQCGQEFFPEILLVVSDMEFNIATNRYTDGIEARQSTVHEHVAREYAKAGYKMPKIVYWNVMGRSKNVPITVDETGAVLVSGFSINILKSIMENVKDMNVVNIVYDTIMNDRYRVNI